MEYLKFEFTGKQTWTPQKSFALAGVVSSGNLEILMEKYDLGGQMSIDVETTIKGFEDTWRAVFEDFYIKHPLSDLRISIHDTGATPAVVSLRLDQAIELIRGIDS